MTCWEDECWMMLLMTCLSFGKLVWGSGMILRSELCMQNIITLVYCQSLSRFFFFAYLNSVVIIFICLFIIWSWKVCRNYRFRHILNWCFEQFQSQLYAVGWTIILISCMVIFFISGVAVFFTSSILCYNFFQESVRLAADQACKTLSKVNLHIFS